MPPILLILLARIMAPRGEEGLATAELLGNAALGVLALVAIWGAMRVLGLDIVDWIRNELITT
ncbi:MAG: hypothetical protein JWL83_1269 [Actinomycetia bacterium]|jgi:hypothetical protein|nr:hypothetical protein [Actinomycetes bacterium]